MANKATPAEAPDTEGKELTAATTTAIMATDDFFEGAGEGMEDFSQQDFTIPFIGILQALSKPLQRGHAKYIKEAQQGMFYNSATAGLYDGEKGLIVIPVHFEHRYVGWKPNNGGIAHDYGSDPAFYDSLTPNERGQRFDPEGNEIIDSLQYFCIIVNEELGTLEGAVFSFSKMQARKGKKWNNLIRAHVEMRNGKPVKPAIYFYAYKITTTPESNDKGSWYGFQIEDYKKLPDMGELGGMAFTEAKNLRIQIQAGEVRAGVDEPDQTTGGAANDGDGEGAF